MKEIQTFDASSKEVYEFYFKDGKLERIYGRDYVTTKTIFDEYREPGKYIGKVDAIVKEHFNRAIGVLCRDRNSNRYEEFLLAMRNDEEYLTIARNIIAKEITWMAEKIQYMNEALRI